MPHPLIWGCTQRTFSICIVVIYHLFWWAFLLSEAQHSFIHLLCNLHLILFLDILWTRAHECNSNTISGVRLQNLQFFDWFCFHTIIHAHSFWSMLSQEPSNWLSNDLFLLAWCHVFKWLCQNLKALKFLQNPIFHVTICKPIKQPCRMNFSSILNAKWTQHVKVFRGFLLEAQSHRHEMRCSYKKPCS